LIAGRAFPGSAYTVIDTKVPRWGWSRVIG